MNSKNINLKSTETLKLMFDYSGRKLDLCGICHQKYNVGDKIPRILVNCGHTFCT